MKNELVILLLLCFLVSNFDQTESKLVPKISNADSVQLKKLSDKYMLPDCPSMNYPANGDTMAFQSNMMAINFTTSGALNPTHSWRLYFGNDPDYLIDFGGYPVGGNGNVGTAMPVSPGETFYWLVTEENDEGESENCEMHSFTVAEECVELNLSIGDACDDGNSLTINDEVNGFCECEGELFVVDLDDDGILDTLDNCVEIWNENQSDYDNDGIGDVCDPDIDGDGFYNVDDCNAYDSSIFLGAICDDGNPLTYVDIYNADCTCAGYLDTDLDDIPDFVDNCPFTSNEDQEDHDGDGIGDVCDADLDGDDVPNDIDCNPVVGEIYQGSGCDDGDPNTFEDVLNAFCICEGLPLDTDSDSIPDIIDNCIDIPNTSQSDLDGDLIGDDCDEDIDNDSFPNDSDCDPYDNTVYVGAICDDGDPFSLNDVINSSCMCEGEMSDIDMDGIADHLDNCVENANTNQLDLDMDGLGDLCDEDIDGDGDLNFVDCEANNAAVYFGAACDDGNAETENDIILSDCACLGTPIDKCELATAIFCGDVIMNNTNTGELESTIPFCDLFLGFEPGVWYKFIGQGELVSLDLSGSLFDTELAVFSGGCQELNCVTGNDDFNGTLQSKVEFFGVADVPYFVYVTGYQNGTGSFTMSVSCNQTADNAVCDNAEGINEGIVYDAQVEGGLGASESCFINGDNSVWYKYTATATGNCVISSSIDPDGPDTRLSVFQGSCNNLICFGASDDINSNTFTSEVSFPVQSGQKYYIEWDDRWSDEAFDFEISVSDFDCPTLLANIGDACDDGDPLTDNDLVQNDCTCSGVISCNTRDKMILETCYNVWGGSATNLNWDFNNNDPVTESWTGISVDANSGCVTKIVLKSKGLQGYLPEDLSQLTALTQLRITRNNSLSGELPSTISELPNISVINLRKNNITGCIPESWATFCGGGTMVSLQENPNWDFNSFNLFCSFGVGSCQGHVANGQPFVNQNRISEDLFENTEISIYPNPNTGDQLYIAFDGDYGESPKEANITIINIYGQPMAYEKVIVNDGKMNHLLNFDRDLASGIYLVSVEINGDVQTKRLIIE